ncbi:MULTISPECIES: hypothetical protein [unclassified Microbacterium]|uniref:hypothetical protein n=1 Tax=unclassified Microbacterium TaxID=2609290 RepID=UPI0034268177
MATIKTKSNLIHLDTERIKRRGDEPMGGAETLDEYEFLIDNGTHPLLAAQMLGVPYANLQKLARDHERSGLFNRMDIGEWNRFAHDNHIPSRWAA